MNNDNKTKGLNLSIIIPAGIVLMVISVIAFYEGRKAYWDYQVDKMCEKDGGIVLHQVLEVDNKEYNLYKNKFGQIDIPRKDRNKRENSGIIHTYVDTYLRRANPEVRKSTITVIHLIDNTVLATSTTYSRVGGDVFSLHPSYYSCPSIVTNIFDLVLINKGMKK